MNKKGFAISVILYSIIFLIIVILYMLLGIAKTRYTVNKGLKDSIISDLNEERNEVEYTSSESCEIVGNSLDYTPDLVLTITVSNYGKLYKYDDNEWSDDANYTVDHSGIYIGYFKDTNGGIGTCSVDIISKTVYRYRDCDEDDYMYSEKYYDASGEHQDIIGCYFNKDEVWSNWSDVVPESLKTREIESRTSYTIK